MQREFAAVGHWYLFLPPSSIKVHHPCTSNLDDTTSLAAFGSTKMSSPSPNVATKDIEKDNEKAIDHEIFSMTNSSIGKSDLLFHGMQAVDPALNAKMFIVNNVSLLSPHRLILRHSWLNIRVRLSTKLGGRLIIGNYSFSMALGNWRPSLIICDASPTYPYFPDMPSTR